MGEEKPTAMTSAHATSHVLVVEYSIIQSLSNESFGVFVGTCKVLIDDDLQNLRSVSRAPTKIGCRHVLEGPGLATTPIGM